MNNQPYCETDITLNEYHIAGLKTRIAEIGSGPAVLLLHGWPECWYSWRSQMVALANAGYRAIAPDMPGFAGTDDFPRCEDYNIETISVFILNIIDTLAESPVLMVAHDWGAAIAWHFTLRHPNAVSKLITMSVPLRPHGDTPPTQKFIQQFGDRFFYQLYFQTPPHAENEFDANPYGILSRLYCAPDTPREKPLLSNRSYVGGGWIDRLGRPTQTPDWISESELQYYVSQYKQRGFHGGICYYRNIDRNWEMMADYSELTLHCPVLFIAGSADNSIARASEEELYQSMQTRVPNIKIALLPNYGHWIQREAAEQVNTLMLSFLKTS
ncbi:epoxide hydrolase EphA [Aurantivibrio plasticivorans]